MQWLIDRITELVEFLAGLLNAIIDAVLLVVGWLRDWFIGAVDYLYTMLMGWFWGVAEGLGVSDFFESLSAFAEIGGPYLEFAVWAIPIVPVTTIIVGAWSLAWVIVGIRHGLGVLWFNPG